MSTLNCARCGVSLAMRSKLHVAFEVGVILKGLNGLFELVGGVLLLVFPPSAIEKFIVGLTSNELSKDPHDVIASHLREAAHSLSANDQLFAAIYLLAHGIIKAVLVYALIRDKLWAFPIAIGVFTAFGVYQMYRYFTYKYRSWLCPYPKARLLLPYQCARSRTSMSVMISRGWPRDSQPR